MVQYISYKANIYKTKIRCFPMTHKIESWHCTMLVRLPLNALLTLGKNECSPETYFKKSVLKWRICMIFYSNFKVRERRFRIQTFRKCHSRTQMGVADSQSVFRLQLRLTIWGVQDEGLGNQGSWHKANNNPTIQYKLILDHLVQIYRLKNWLGLIISIKTLM